jgi:hypothetical protein
MTPGRLLAALVLLSGCARAPVTTSSRATEPEPDCSFHAATTCWTLGPRVPAPERQASDTAPDRLLRQPPAVLASRGDSVGAP